jgi:hypothetical protein
MTVTHLLFAAVTTAYILFAIQLEERDLMHAHPEYAAYRRNVPMIVPFISDRRSANVDRPSSRRSAMGDPSSIL